jgi:hypothetical protein
MRRIQFALISILLGVAAPVAAQAASSSDAGFHVGFGASISTVTGTVAPLFLVPVDVGSHFRVEPEVGYTRTMNEQTIQTTPPTVPLPIPVPIVTNITTRQVVAVPSIGTGVFFVQSREKIRLHYGARLGYARTSTEFSSVSRTITAATSTTNTTTKQTGYFVGPALGGEYFLGDRFSLGAELHVRYTSTDGRQRTVVVPLTPPPPNVIVPSPPQTTTSVTTIQTRASIVARVYLK